MIEFSYHTASNFPLSGGKRGRHWIKYQHGLHNSVIKQYYNYWLRIDGKILVTWTPDFLENEVEKRQIWKTLND